MVRKGVAGAGSSVWHCPATLEITTTSKTWSDRRPAEGVTEEKGRQEGAQFLLRSEFPF